MSNEEYQHLLRVPTGELREALAGGYPERLGILQLLKQIDDEGVALALRDLGHDLGDLLEAFTEADQVTDRPSAIFAYTIKAWCLPTQDHPANHSALLTTDQWRALAVQLGADPDDPWAPFPPDSSKGAVCVAAAERLRRIETGPDRIVKVPEDLGLSHHVKESTQQALGRFLLDVSRGPRAFRANRDRQPGRGLFHESWRMDQPRWHLEHRRAHRLV